MACTVKIKRCGEMARKLRYFKDQMSKAGFTPSVKIEAKDDINLDDLEVYIKIVCRQITPNIRK